MLDGGAVVLSGFPIHFTIFYVLHHLDILVVAIAPCYLRQWLVIIGYARHAAVRTSDRQILLTDHIRSWNRVTVLYYQHGVFIFRIFVFTRS